MKKIILSAFVLSTLFVSCKKDKKDNCDLNSTNILGSYKVASVSYKANSATPAVDLLVFSDVCEKDDITVFNANNTLTYTDAGVVCTPPGGDTGVWSLSGNTLNLDGEVGTVSSFDCNGMTVNTTGTAAGEVTTVILVKQ